MPSLTETTSLIPSRIRRCSPRQESSWARSRFPIAKSYIDDYIGLVDAVFGGTAVIEDKLNHPFVEMDPKAQELCRVRYKKASIFIKKAEVMKVYGKGE